MKFNYKHLNNEIRSLIKTEIEAAIERKTLYYSKQFNPDGHEAWPGLLMQAALEHDEHWLGYHLDDHGFFKNAVYRKTPSGGYTIVKVPSDAAQKLADCEFNRYYMIAVCRLAINQGKQITIVRAKQRGEQRPDSVILEGKRLDPGSLISEISPLPSFPPHDLCKPNSGLSIEIAA